VGTINSKTFKSPEAKPLKINNTLAINIILYSSKTLKLKGGGGLIQNYSSRENFFFLEKQQHTCF
jgi:hypothetical protein